MYNLGLKACMRVVKSLLSLNKIINYTYQILKNLCLTTDMEVENKFIQNKICIICYEGLRI